MTRRARVSLGAALALSLSLSIAGCSAPTPAGPATDTAAADAEARAIALAVELGISAEVYRTRIDPSRGGIQLAVRNDGVQALQIVRVALESPALAAPVERERATELAAGVTRDLALTLTPAACPAENPAPPMAVLTIETSGGGTAELRVPTTDRLGQWGEWLAAECFAAAVAERAILTVRHDAAADNGALIGLRLEVEPQTPGLELVAIGDTVLFGLVQLGDDARVTSLPLTDLDVDGDAASIPLQLTPARCDSHALADDKQGTLFTVDVVLDGEPGSVTIVADAATKASLYDAFSRACGLR